MERYRSRGGCGRLSSRRLVLNESFLSATQWAGRSRSTAAKRMPGTVVAVIGVDTLHNAEYKWPEDQIEEVPRRVRG